MSNDKRQSASAKAAGISFLSVVGSVLSAALWICLIWAVYMKLPTYKRLFDDFGSHLGPLTVIVVNYAAVILPLVGVAAGLPERNPVRESSLFLAGENDRELAEFLCFESAPMAKNRNEPGLKRPLVVRRLRLQARNVRARIGSVAHRRVCSGNHFSESISDASILVQ